MVVVTMRLQGRRGSSPVRWPPEQSSHLVSLRTREAMEAAVTAGKTGVRDDRTGPRHHHDGPSGGAFGYRDGALGAAFGYRDDPSGAAFGYRDGPPGAAFGCRG